MSSMPFASDLRLALRSLRRTPGFTATSILMLGLAIGTLSGVFGVVRHVLLEPLPFTQPQQLVFIAGSAPGTQMPPDYGLGDEFFVHYAERSQLIENLATYNNFTNTLRVDERAERIRMSWPTASLFSTLGVAPALGHLPDPQQHEPVVVLSDKLWADWFGRDPSVIGRSVELFGQPREVVAVMPPAFRFPTDATLLWITQSITATDLQDIGDFGGGLVARLKPGVTHAALATELTALAKELPDRFGGPASFADTIAHFVAVTKPLEERILGSYERPLWLMLGAGALVLVIACANLTNLFLVRTETRTRELALRRALGAGRAALLRLQLAESLLIGAGAGVLALIVAALGLPLLLHVAPPGVPRLDTVGIDAITLAFTLLVALLAGLCCGLLPALRGASPKLERLREGGRGMTTRQHWVRQGLVAAQTALALLLLIGAGLMLRSVQALHAVDPGYDARDVFTFQFAPEQAQLTDAASWARFHLAFMDRLKALPGVASVGIVENVPIDEGAAPVRVRTQDMQVPAESGALVLHTYSAGDYFQAMGIKLLAGRVFTAADHEGHGNVLVSARAAELLWPGQQAVGQRLQRTGQTQWETVVGVVGDVHQQALDVAPEALIYLPLVGPEAATSRPLSSPGYVIKSSRAAMIAGEVRALIREVAPEAPMYRQYLMEELIASTTARSRFTLLTLGLAASLALLLGAIGLYGVLSYVVAERGREIGLRMALGARMAQVQTMVLAQGARVVTTGLVLGLLAAFALSRMLGSLLFGVSALDPLTFGGMTAAMLATGALASYLPARRAARMDPMVLLRRE